MDQQDPQSSDDASNQRLDPQRKGSPVPFYVAVGLFSAWMIYLGWLAYKVVSQ